MYLTNDEKSLQDMTIRNEILKCEEVLQRILTETNADNAKTQYELYKKHHYALNELEKTLGNALGCHYALSEIMNFSEFKDHIK